MTALQYQFSKRIVAAALRLAAVYAACVLIELAAVLTVVVSPQRVIKILPILSIPGTVCFAAAFVLLAIARRAGFIAAWLVLFCFWTRPLVVGGGDHPSRAAALIIWSVFAAPLYAMVMLGFQSDTAVSPARRWWAWILGVLWLALLIVNVRFAGAASESGGIWLFIEPLSVIMPIAITAVAIRRIWRTKAPTAR